MLIIQSRKSLGMFSIEAFFFSEHFLTVESIGVETES